MSDETWSDLNRTCKEATGFDAKEVAVALWAEDLDPGDEVEWNDATEALSNIIGSSGDTHSRGAAIGIFHQLREAGYDVVERREQRT